MTLFTSDQFLCWTIALTLMHVTWLGCLIGIVAVVSNHLFRKSTAEIRYWMNFAALFTFAVCLPVVFLVVSKTTDRSLSSHSLAITEMDSSRAVSTNAQSSFEEISFDQVDSLNEGGNDSLASLKSSPILPEWNRFDLNKIHKAASQFMPPWAARVFVALYLLGVSFMLFRLAGAVRKSQTLRRYDHMLIIFQRLFESVLFFHPAMWYLSRRIDDERECCCDDLVVASGADRIKYATSLLGVAEIRLKHRSAQTDAVAMAADGHRPSKLRRRILRILGEESPSRIGAGNSWLSGLLILLAVVSVWSMGQVTFGKPPLVAAKQEVAKQEVTDSQVDHGDDILKLAAKTRESYAAIKTAHIRIQRAANLQNYNPDITPKDCENLILDLDLVSHPENVKTLLTALSKNPNKYGEHKLWYDYEMHFAKDKLRTSTEWDQSKNGPDIHITNATHSIIWDAANYQMDIEPVQENRRHQYRLGDFVQPLPFDDANKLEKSCRIVSHDSHYTLLDHEPPNSFEIQIDKTTGFTLHKRRSNREQEVYSYWLDWKQYPGKINFPQVVATFNFADGVLTRCELLRIESARFNVAIPDSVFAMSAPAGANIVGDINGRSHYHLESDVFDVTSVEQLTAATKRAKTELTEEEKRGVEAAKKLYTLTAGQALIRLGPPFPLARKYVPQMVGGQASRRPGQDSWILMQDGDKLTRTFTFGNGIFDLNTLVEQLFSLHSSSIEGDEDLLAMEIQGDFLFRNDSKQVDLVKALKRILEDELQENITVEFRDVDRPVYIATGDLKLNLRPNQTQVEMNAGPYEGNNGLIINRGDLNTFTSDLSNYIDANVVNQATPNAERFEWAKRWYDIGDASERPPNGFDFQVPEVLKIVSEQTGLTFHKEIARKKILFIERTKF